MVPNSLHSFPTHSLPSFNWVNIAGQQDVLLCRSRNVLGKSIKCRIRFNAEGALCGMQDVQLEYKRMHTTQCTTEQGVVVWDANNGGHLPSAQGMF